MDWSFQTGGEQLLGRGNATIGGFSGSGVDFVGALSFEATPTPFPMEGETNVVFTAPFTFTGYIRGLTGGEQQFIQDFVGAGTVKVDYQPGAAPGLFVEDDDTILYEFAEPIPEPGTLLLLASGLGMALTERRRRTAGRKRRSAPVTAGCSGCAGTRCPDRTCA